MRRRVQIRESSCKEMPQNKKLKNINERKRDQMDTEN